MVKLQQIKRLTLVLRQKTDLESMWIIRCELTALIAPVISATFRQFRNSPEEWKKTGAGFARRFGDSFGRNLVNQTVTYGLDEALKLDSNYYLSKKPDFKSKFSNAVVSAFTARTPSGKRVIGAPKIIGTYSAAILAK